MNHEIDVDDDHVCPQLPPTVGELLPKVIERLRHLLFVRDSPSDYQLYLRTKHWQQVRAAALLRYDNRCAVCNSPDQPDVHHRTYERRGCERPEDVIVLCRGCHDLFHKNGKLFRS